MLLVAPTAMASARLDLQLLETEVNPGAHNGLYNVTLQARTVGASTGQGDGGLSDLQFAIVSTDHGQSNVLAAGTGALASKSKITWDSTVTSNFSTVNPLRTDLGSDGDFDLSGGAFFDSNNFNKTDLGVPGWVSIMTTQFQLSAADLAPSHLAVIPSNAQYYDFTNGTSPNFRGTFTSIYTAGMTIGYLDPTPDPLTPFPEPRAATIVAATLPLTTCRRRLR